MNLKAHIAQVAETQKMIDKLSDEAIEQLTRWADEIRKKEPDFELTDFTHTEQLPTSFDLFHLYVGQVLKTKSYVNAGRAIVAVNNESGQWLTNLKSPWGAED